MFVTTDPGVAAAVRRLRAFGVDRSYQERTVPGLYDTLSLGLNYRLSEMQAALGCGQVQRLTENLARRRQNYTELQQRLASLEGIRVLAPADARAQSSYYCLSFVLEASLAVRREHIVARLNAAGVGTSIYYPHPVPRLHYYRQKYGYQAQQFPVAAAISDRSIALPVGPHLHPADMAYIGDTIATILREEAL